MHPFDPDASPTSLSARREGAHREPTASNGHTSSRTPPLCVDLDDTLIRTDLLVEGIIQFVRDHPRKTFALIGWFQGGRAAAKTELAKWVAPAVELLPYRASILDLIIQRREAGAPVILTTASPHAWAERVAQYLGLFDEVLATTETTNLKGPRKRDLLVERYGEKGFDYVGDSSADIPIWGSCRVGYAIAGNSSLTRELPDHVHLVPQSQRSHTPPVRRWLRALRVHQWAKNLLVLVPLIMAHEWRQPSLLIQAGAAFASFSLAASAIYLLNDLVDLESDRGHRSKRNRPFASGEVGIGTGLVASVLCLLSSVLLTPLTDPFFILLLLLYLVTTSLYSFTLKRIPIVDIFVLASLYTLRIFAGAAATTIAVSPWLLAFSLFFFLGLASAKRYVEFDTSATSPATSRRGYLPSDTAWIANLGMGTGLVSVLVLALYIQGPDVITLYRHPAGLWFLSPLVLFWISRVWFLAHRQQLHEDPVVFALRDPASLVIGALAAMVVLLSI